MKVILIANSEQEKEFKSSMTDEGLQLTTIPGIQELDGSCAQVCIDLQFENTEERRKQLEGTGAELIIVNYVPGTLEKLGSRYVRINGWNSFLRRTIVEACAGGKETEQLAGNVLSRFGKRVEWVPDIPGFITSRVVAQIINEAYFSLEEEVSTREDIDTAMKLGTNYPYGPFEWGNIIGLDRVALLLRELYRTAPRYQPSELLMKESGC
jgi:3-hydroxybutyryl-CoA dehydrogenase